MWFIRSSAEDRPNRAKRRDGVGSAESVSHIPRVTSSSAGKWKSDVREVPARVVRDYCGQSERLGGETGHVLLASTVRKRDRGAGQRPCSRYRITGRLQVF